DFLPSLRRHLASRLTGQTEEIVSADCIDHLDIKDNRLYSHKVVQFNYPTYDMRRAQDTVNPRTHPDVMLLAQDDDGEHPYWYARVVGVYHTIARYTGPGSSGCPWRQVDLLWVCWFARDTTYPSGIHQRRLPRVSFVTPDYDDFMAFSFVDPASVLRAAYIIPAFASGTTSETLPSHSVARKNGEDEDYNFYHVCM
ncbi:hypothetical protein BD413DRAFT_488638, partial [Trametes elegans]